MRIFVYLKLLVCFPCPDISSCSYFRVVLVIVCPIDQTCSESGLSMLTLNPLCVEIRLI